MDPPGPPSQAPSLFTVSTNPEVNKACWETDGAGSRVLTGTPGLVVLTCVCV